MTPRLIPPTEVSINFYTITNEKDSMYDGSYSMSKRIATYKTIDGIDELVVPYTLMEVDYRYGFYEFETKEELKYWLLENSKHNTKSMCDQYPEFFI